MPGVPVNGADNGMYGGRLMTATSILPLASGVSVMVRCVSSAYFVAVNCTLLPETLTSAATHVATACVYAASLPVPSRRLKCTGVTFEPMRATEYVNTVPLLSTKRAAIRFDGGVAS